MSIDELNEDEDSESEKVNARESKVINYFGLIAFVLIGIFVWSILGITIGRVSSLLSPDNFWKWILYFFMYFIFLRFPFGVGNKMVKRAYDFETFNEKVIFSVAMIASYILALCCYDSIPNLLTSHLYFLDI